MGWLDWDFNRAMCSDCSAILLALDGKMGMLKAIYGDGSKKAETVAPALTPAALRGMGR